MKYASAGVVKFDIFRLGEKSGFRRCFFFGREQVTATDKAGVLAAVSSAATSMRARLGEFEADPSKHRSRRLEVVREASSNVETLVR